jgi:hypothetical protein
MIIIVPLSHQKGEIEETVTTHTYGFTFNTVQIFKKFDNYFTIIVAGTARSQVPPSQKPAGSSNGECGRLAVGQADLTESWFCWWSMSTATLVKDEED